MRLFKLSLILLTLCAAQNVLAYSLECHGANGLEYKRSHNDGGANMTPYEYLKVNGVEYIVSTNPNGPIYKAATFSLDKIVKGKVSANGFNRTTLFTAVGLVKIKTATVMPVPIPVQCKEVTYHGPPRPSIRPQH